MAHVHTTPLESPFEHGGIRIGPNLQGGGHREEEKEEEIVGKAPRANLKGFDRVLHRTAAVQTKSRCYPHPSFEPRRSQLTWPTKKVGHARRAAAADWLAPWD